LSDFTGAALEGARDVETPQTLDEACNPQRLALIVYDMEVGILQPVLPQFTVGNLSLSYSDKSTCS
jgi:hypothetical protein